MKMRRMGKKNKVRLSKVWTRALWVCLLTGLLAVRPGARAVFAQSAGTQAEVLPAAASVLGATGVSAATPEPAAKPEITGTAVDPRKKQIAEAAADLMRLANSLKIEVGKTTPDTMSVTVVREAEEIEKLAHRMRSK